MFRKPSKAFSKGIYIPLSLFAESFEAVSCFSSCHSPVRLHQAFLGLVFFSAAKAKSVSWFPQILSSCSVCHSVLLSLCTSVFPIFVPWSLFLCSPCFSMSKQGYALLPALHVPLPLLPLAKATWMFLLTTCLQLPFFSV